MSTHKIVGAAISLPILERDTHAQDLGQSIDSESGSLDEMTLQELLKRDDELTSATVIGRSHEEVMQAARSAIGCA